VGHRPDDPPLRGRGRPTRRAAPADGAAVIRIGHRGAPLLAPENTVRSIRRAIELGMDFVEIDVVPLADGTLVLAHSDDLAELSHGVVQGRVTTESLEELREVAPELPTLDEALAAIAESDAGVQLDVKAPGYEAGVVEAARRHGLVDRSLASSFHPESLRRLGELEPGLRRGLTYPSDRRGISGRPYARPLVPAVLRCLRAVLPRRIPRLLAAADATTAVLHYSVVSGASYAPPSFV